MLLHNREDKEILKKKLMAEAFRRVTLSFYRYVYIKNPQEFRDRLYLDWSEMNVFGRIYVASEGINAQLSVPAANFEQFKKYLQDNESLRDMPLKIAVEDDGKSFYKLIIKVKKQIVADGLKTGEYDVTNVGKHLTAEEWNQAMEDKNTVIIDMRNHYESEIGRFEGAICPDADTFKDELPLARNLLKGKENKKILLYCTGGVRCEKASSYLKHHGFKDVNQLYGGVIEYAHQIERQELPSRFKGKNFVFDERRGERISADIISTCHQCGAPCDTHVNCANDACHLLFLQCEKCREKYSACCTPQCQEFIALPEEEQRRLRKGQNNSPGVYKSRLRPKLREILQS